MVISIALVEVKFREGGGGGIPEKSDGGDRRTLKKSWFGTAKVVRI